MNALFADYLERLTTLHEGFKTAVHNLPPEALDWQPGPDMNSCTVIISHVAGSERFWIGDMVGQAPSGRVRAEEFEQKGLTAVTLARLLDDTLAHSRRVLESTSLEDLEAERQTPDGRRTHRVAWCLLHNLEHVAIHLGHVEILRQLWDQREDRG